MTPSPVLILGARSDIGLATAHACAAAGHPLQLASLAADTLAPEAQDMRVSHDVEVSLHEFDAIDTAALGAFAGALPILPGVVVCAIGLMGEQDRNETDPDAAREVMRRNFEGPASVLDDFANRFAERGSGTLAGISSVAGDRGCATNYVYGASNAGITAFLSGLRNRLARHGVLVATVLPGFVRTRMTEGMDLPDRLTVEPEEVGRAILFATTRGRDVIYVRPIWRLIMAIICSIPERIFKKLSI